MQNITSRKELRNAIQLQEEGHAIKKQLFKEQVYITFESLKPLNLLNSTLKDLYSSPYLNENILGSVVGIASGYFSKKIVVGASANILRKLFGTILQLGITYFVSQQYDVIKSFGQYIVKQIFRKGKKRSESRGS
jgi:hypothetical protein